MAQLAPGIAETFQENGEALEAGRRMDMMALEGTSLASPASTDSEAMTFAAAMHQVCYTW